MKTIIIISFLLLSMFHVSNAQVTQEWTRTYSSSGNYHDSPRVIAKDDLGNIYVCGNESSNWSSTGDYLVIKYRPDGTIAWKKMYDAPGHGYDDIRSVAVDHMRNVYVTGCSEDPAGVNDVLTIKYDSTGAQQWLRRYDGPANGVDVSTKVRVDAQMNVYVCGHSEGIGTNDDIIIIKYNSSGTQQWLYRYNSFGTSSDYAGSLVIDNSGNVYVGGSDDGDIIGYDRDAILIKYTSNGLRAWVKRFNAPGNLDEWIKFVEMDNSGNIYMAGGSYYPFGEILLIKYTSSGEFLWSRIYSYTTGNTYDICKDIAVDASGNVYLCGDSENQSYIWGATIVKYNTNGVLQWEDRYRSSLSLDSFNDLDIDSLGNVYVAGESRGTDEGNYITIKYNSMGVRQWQRKYDTPNNPELGHCIAVDRNLNVYVSGTKHSPTGTLDITTVKYSQTGDMINLSSETNSDIPKEFSLQQNYPNPFNPTTNIKFGIPKQSFVNISVYDITGRKISEIINRQMSGGIYNVDFEASELPSGTYFYRITAGEFTETKKMILVK